MRRKATARLPDQVPYDGNDEYQRLLRELEPRVRWHLPLDALTRIERVRVAKLFARLFQSISAEDRAVIQDSVKPAMNYVEALSLRPDDPRRMAWEATMGGPLGKLTPRELYPMKAALKSLWGKPPRGPGAPRGHRKYSSGQFDELTRRTVELGEGPTTAARQLLGSGATKGQVDAFVRAWRKSVPR